MVRDILCLLAYLLFYLVLTLAISMALAWWLCDIDPAKEYSWYSGIWQGIFFVPNLVRSWFGDALYKAEMYTTAYNVFYWIFSVLSVIGWIAKPFELLATNSGTDKGAGSKEVHAAANEELTADLGPQDDVPDEMN